LSAGKRECFTLAVALFPKLIDFFSQVFRHFGG
jgi:hypothetical protein